MNLPFLQFNDCGVFIVSLIQSQRVWDGSNYTNVWIQFIYMSNVWNSGTSVQFSW